MAMPYQVQRWIIRCKDISSIDPLPVQGVDAVTRASCDGPKMLIKLIKYRCVEFGAKKVVNASVPQIYTRFPRNMVYELLCVELCCSCWRLS